MAKKRPSRQRANNKPGGANIPTVEPNPVRQYTVVMNDQTDDKKSFTGSISYVQLMGALRSQIKTHVTPALGAAAPDSVWSEPWRYLKVNWVRAWGNPYVQADAVSGVKFSVALYQGQAGARPPPPDKFDFGAGSDDRPYGMCFGTTSHWANVETGKTNVISLQDADVIHVSVSVW